MWATRLLLGGNSVNGFLKACATAQRIKKQRARQNNSSKHKQQKQGDGGSGSGGKAAAAAAAGGKTAAGGSTSKGEAFDQAEEEQLKKEIMNPRTAKKIKSELEQGLVFCATVCNVLRGVLFDIDNSLAPALPPALIIEQPKPPPKPTFLVPSNPAALAAQQQQQQQQQQLQKDAADIARASFKANASGIPSAGPNNSSSAVAVKALPAAASAGPTSKATKQPQQKPKAQKTTASSPPSDKSTLRKSRKKKLVSTEPPVNLPEFDANGKRTCTKKEYQHRVFQLLRYRELREGDFCAARLSSRDLWILAKVVSDYKLPHNLMPIEFLQLSDVKRDALFRERVWLKDVEEREDTGSTPVARNLVLPLPRSCAEASDWTHRLLKKGSRVYAMYPQTTSLYPATVVDSTTYCRGDDDIIVVEFDGEEVDGTTGQVPSYHIPARFVTLIPREFPASQPAKESGKRKSTTASGGSAKKRASTNNSGGGGGDAYLDMIAMDFDSAGGGLGFDALDLDFDKPLDDNEQQDDFPPF